MADQAEVLAVAGRLRRCGAFRGAAQVLFNAAAQLQATQVRHLPQRPAFGVGIEAGPDLHAANDEHPTTPEPAPSGGGL